MGKVKDCSAAFSTHLTAGVFTPKAQQISVAMRADPDGEGVFAILRIEGCVSQTEGEWLGRKVAGDLGAWLVSNANETGLHSLVSVHCWRPHSCDLWTTAIGAETSSRDAAADVIAWFEDYLVR